MKAYGQRANTTDVTISDDSNKHNPRITLDDNSSDSISAAQD